MAKCGEAPVSVGHFDINLAEVMYYLYLPVRMPAPLSELTRVRLPPNVECCRPLIEAALEATDHLHYDYVYLSARKGWATPDNPLNRPGWHCDGFGTDDLNFVWWRGPGTRFITGEWDVSDDHVESLRQFDSLAAGAESFDEIFSPPEATLYSLTPRVVHATPLIGAPGCMRQYVKVSLSNSRYNLENNSHNYLFDYDWPLHSREVIRNDTHRAQADSVSALGRAVEKARGGPPDTPKRGYA